MNFHPSPTASPFAPDDWTIEIAFEKVGLSTQCIGILSRKGVVMCRLSEMDESGDCETARMNLAEKARAWVADFLTRTAT